MFALAPGAGGVPGDPTPPEITPTVVGTLGLGGWYRSNVTVNWSIVDPESIILSSNCVLATTLAADTPGTRLTCSASSDGGETTKTLTVKLDKTAPAVTAAPSRAPNAGGWYNTAVAVTFSGTDATSGIASATCTSTQYAGPDNGAAVVAGSCSDNAGNVTGASFPLKYDATAPSFTVVTAKRGNRSFALAWKASSDTTRVEVRRSPGQNGAPDALVYQGAADTYRDTGLVPGRTYQYTVSGFDEALNKADRTLLVTASGALFNPLPGVTVKKPPIFAWARVRKASYYNIQLIRGRRVFSAWPARPSFRLPRTWIYRGRRHRLRPGHYRWYVWPGFGRISAQRYGRMLGSSTFVVTR